MPIDPQLVLSCALPFEHDVTACSYFYAQVTASNVFIVCTPDCRWKKLNRFSMIGLHSNVGMPELDILK